MSLHERSSDRLIRGHGGLGGKPTLRGVTVCLAMLGCVLSAPALAQSADPAAPAAVSKETREALDAGLAGIRAARAGLAEAEARVVGADPARGRIEEHRRETAERQLFESALAWLAALQQAREDGLDVSAYLGEAASLLGSLPAEIRRAEVRLLPLMVAAPENAPAAEQAAADLKILAAIDAQSELIGFEVAAAGFADGLELKNDAERELLRADLTERAETIAALLDLSIQDAAVQQSRLALLPEDAEVKALAAVTQNRVTSYAAALDSTAKMMGEVGLETDTYDRQVLAVTGDLSADVLDVGVLGGMVSDWTTSISTSVTENAPTMLLRLFLFVLILFASLKLGQFVQSLVERTLSSSHVRLSQLLHRMLLSGSRNLIVFLGFLIALSQIGISLGPVLAGLGIAGFVLGFALQDSLSNFASGLMILLYRPLDVGDLVEAGGVFGTVDNMSLVNTTILTLDNQTLIVPNNMIWTQVIKNVTKQRTRRVDMVFGISYADDIPKAEGVLMEVLEKNEKVLSDPAPNVRVHELGDSSVNFVVRPWCQTEDYWDIWWDVTKAVKMRFDEEDISIPFPQRDVHFYPTDAQAHLAASAGAPPTASSAVHERPPPSDADSGSESEQADQ